MNLVAKCLLYCVVVTSMCVHVHALLTYTLEEESDAGTFIGNIKTDSELSLEYDNATFQSLTYRLRYSSGLYALFSVSQRRGELRSASRIDREAVCQQTNPCHIDLDVTTQPVQYFHIIKVRVHLLDVNDHSPRFPQQTIIRAISESIQPDATFPLPSADDSDTGINAVQRYELTSLDDDVTRAMFRLATSENADGSRDISLVLLAQLDREVKSEYSLRVTAFDGATSPKTGTLLIDVTVTDANDNKPVFDEPTYEVTIPENTQIGSSIIKVRHVFIRVTLCSVIELS